MHAWSNIKGFLLGLALLGEKMKKDETFQLIRWINLFLGIWNMYYYMVSGNPIVLSIGVLNIGVWALTRKN